jgi:signal transduction histidine kinase
MNPLSLPPILSSILFLALGVFIYFQDKKSKINFTFLLVCVATFWWQFSWFVLFNTYSALVANIIVKIGYVGIIILPVTFLHFFLYFLGKTDIFNKVILYLSYLIALFFEFELICTPNLINSYYSFFWGFYPKAGQLHPFFLVFLGSLALRIIYLSLIGIKKEPSDSLKHRQLEYLLLALVFYAFSASDFIVNYGYEFYPLGFVPILLFLGFVGYAIAKYRLMNIRIIIAQFSVGIIGLLLLGQIFTSKNNFEYTWKAALFVVFLFFGFFLIKSVLREIKLREQLETAYVELARLDKAKSEFVSIASHQLRTPLTAIKGYVSMMLDGSYGEISGTLKGKLQNVFQSSERLIRLVNDLLSISRIESGKVEINLQETAVEDVIASTVDVLKLSAQSKKIKLVWAKPKTPLPKISADPDKMREVVLNLVDNAIKYTQKGSISIALEKIPSYLLLKVKDTGEGMEPEEIAKLFKSFSRGTAGNEHFTEGAGLGLYIARKFVELQNGQIWVESEGKGKGSTFFVKLPLIS